jgi:DNA-binding MarR family transcriptional regulator
MGFSGSLEDFGLSDVLQLIHIGRRTGVLVIISDGQRAEIFFQDGEAVHAILGDVIGEQAVYKVFNWSRGKFDFEAKIVPTPKTITVGSQNLILEATRRIDEWSKLKNLIPGENAVLSFSPNPPDGSHNITLSPEEWRILSLIDSKRTVDDLAKLTGFSTLYVTKTLYGLVSSGLLEVTGKKELKEEEVRHEEAEKGTSAFQTFIGKIGGTFGITGVKKLEEEEEEFTTKVGIVLYFLNRLLLKIVQPDGLYNPVKLPWKLNNKLRDLSSNAPTLTELTVRDGLFDIRESEIVLKRIDDISQDSILIALSKIADELFEEIIKSSNKSAALRRYNAIFNDVFCEGRRPEDLSLSEYISERTL